MAQKIPINSGSQNPSYSALQAQAQRLRAEVQGLNTDTDLFAQKLAALGQTQQQLAALQRQLESLGTTQAEAAEQAGKLSGAAATDNSRLAEANAQRSALLEQRLADDTRIANAQLAVQQTQGEQAVQIAIDQTQRRMAALDELGARQQQQAQAERELTEARLQLSQAASQAFLEVNSAFASGNQDFAGAQKALFLFSRALAVRDVVIATQKEIATVNATYAATPPVAAALTAKAIASGAARVAVIAAQTVPKLSQGGLLDGPSHAQGGIRLVDSRTGRAVAEAEGGELILTRGVARNPVLLNLASQINQLAGGVRLSDPARSVPQMASGGVVPELSVLGSSLTDDLARLATTLANRPVVVSVEEINRVNSRVQVLEQAAEL